MESLKSQSSATNGGSNKQGMMRYRLRGLFGTAFFGVLLFYPAGTVAWSWGWVYLGVFLLVTLVSSWVTDPELLAEERGRGKEGRKGWDFILVSIYGILTALATPIIAGFDFQHSWSPFIPAWIRGITLVIYLFGWGLHLWAMAVNKFFSTVTRIQTERGHRAVTTGPYQYVRHPGYVGGILFNLGAPLILGSLWALIPSGIGALILVWRTILEDRTLQLELEGYSGYMEQVRYRLMPGLW